MADNDSTTDDKTPAELAEEFPINSDPFSVWFMYDPKDNRARWAVNDENGDGLDAPSYAVARKLSRSLFIAHEWDSPHRAVNVAATIALMADSLKEAFATWDGDEAALSYLLMQGIGQLGYLADQCQSPLFRVRDEMAWFMPKTSELDAMEAPA
ncbi:MAG TPA: hypothetical protein VGK14_09860 [Novimethylophilus sp.]|jgi:hypothetical protein|uniref:hypothetical protein n=1 Tax=Novimethylophilus sp. TaxID=2137426 RepID=UPI002F42DB6E